MVTQDVPDYAQQVAAAVPSVTQSQLDKVLTASALGVTEIVAAVAGKSIVVVSYVLVANGAVNVKFQSHTTPTDLTGLLYLAANGGVVAGFNQQGWFRTISGQALDINLSAAVAVGGHLNYVLV